MALFAYNSGADTMDETSRAGQSRSQKAPEEIRAERIAAVADPNVRQELDKLAKARDAELALAREKQRDTYDKRVQELRDQKMKSANAPILTPRGMRAPYLGETGYARATSDAKAEIQTQNHEYLKKLAREYNGQIDKRLDAHRENQAGREPGRIQAQEAEPLRAPTVKSRPPNRYAALVSRQNYQERAKQAELDRQRTPDPSRQPPRDRGPER